MELLLYFLGLTLVLAFLWIAFCLLWNISMAVLYFTLVWVPPYLLCVGFLILTPFMTFLVCMIYKRQGSTDWTSSIIGIRSVWRKSIFSWSLAPIHAITALVWAYSLWPTLWPGDVDLPFLESQVYWSKDTIHNIFLSRSFGAFFLCAIPSILSFILMRRLAEVMFVGRVLEIDSLVRGSDEHTARLLAIDAKILKAYQKFRSTPPTEHAAVFRTWVNSSVHVIIQDKTAVRAPFLEIIQRAENELQSLQGCVTRLDAARVALDALIILQIKFPSHLLIRTIKQVELLLVSDELAGMVHEQKWETVQLFLGEVEEGLLKNQSMAKEWASTSPENDTPSATEDMTVREALLLTGLSSTHTRVELNSRRVELCRTYHPDLHRNTAESNRMTALLLKAFDILAKRMEVNGVQ